MDVSIATICHPPYYRHLPAHLQSIKEAIDGRDIPVHIVVSQANDAAKERGTRMVCEAGLNADLTFTPEHITIGEARNRLFERNGSEWMLFLDADVTLRHDYFDHLERFMRTYDTKNVGAIAGGIGLRHATAMGWYEGAMDLVALVGKIEGIDKSIYQEIFDDIQVANYKNRSVSEEDFWTRVHESLIVHEGKNIRYLQGFNQVIHRGIFDDHDGFDRTFMSAEDREMAAKILSSGKRILFAPQSLAFHIYDFSFMDILRRKSIHGEWCAKFRRKYVGRPDVVQQYDAKRWLDYAKTAIDPPAPFDMEFTGRVYYAASFLAYALSGMAEDARRKIGNGE